MQRRRRTCNTARPQTHCPSASSRRRRWRRRRRGQNSVDDATVSCSARSMAPAGSAVVGGGDGGGGDRAEEPPQIVQLCTQARSFGRASCKTRASSRRTACRRDETSCTPPSLGLQAIDLDRPARASCAKSSSSRPQAFCPLAVIFAAPEHPVDVPLAVMFWLAALALYAGGRVLDIFWALWSRSWPLTLVFYLPFALPLELAFYFHSRRFVRKRSEELHTTFVGEPDAAEARGATAHPERPPARRARGAAPAGSSARASRGAAMCGSSRSCTTRRPSSCRRGSATRSAASSSPEGRARCRRRRRRPPMAYSLDALEACAKPLAYYLLLQSAHAVLGVASASAVTQRVTTTAAARASTHRVPAPRRPTRRRRSRRSSSSTASAGCCRTPAALRLLHSDGYIFVPYRTARSPRSPPPSRSGRRCRTSSSTRSERCSRATRRPPRGGLPALLAPPSSIVKRAPELASPLPCRPDLLRALLSPRALQLPLCSPALRGARRNTAQRKLATEEPSVQDCFRRGWWSQHWLAPPPLLRHGGRPLGPGRRSARQTRRVSFASLTQPSLPTQLPTRRASAATCCAGRRGSRRRSRSRSTTARRGRTAGC